MDQDSGQEAAAPALPGGFVQRLRQLIPPDAWDACWRSFNEPKWTSFRVNTLLADVPPVLTDLEAAGITPTPIPWWEVAFSVPPEQRDRLLSHAACRQALIYVQNPSSMMPCLVLDPQPGEEVLDLAAAPGGKTTLLTALMGNRGRVAAVEPVRKRFYKLRHNIGHYGAQIVHLYQVDGRRVGSKTPARFDRVLLDAPCSGEARFRWDDASTYQYWSERKIREQARKQVGLIRSAIRALRPGGRLVYCTCSLAPEENELAVAKAMRREAAAVEVVPMTLPPHVPTYRVARWQGQPLADCGCRILPDRLYDAFFMCQLVKRDES